ncbi:MAG: PadR family transcriptional regulator [Candidatus Berkelbacteria bacterium]|nr:PadR family transcriptional regulator [Candidatus Berkelbacteria bacterium]
MVKQMKFDDEKYWRTLINQGLIRFFLLKVLFVDKESYGYKMVKRIEEISDGLCRPTESTIYPALEQLMSGGYLDVTKLSSGKKVRKVYSLNDKGRAAFRAAAKAYGEIIPVLRQAIML